MIPNLVLVFSEILLDDLWCPLLLSEEICNARVTWLSTHLKNSSETSSAFKMKSNLISIFTEMMFCLLESHHHLFCSQYLINDKIFHWPKPIEYLWPAWPRDILIAFVLTSATFLLLYPFCRNKNIKCVSITLVFLIFFFFPFLEPSLPHFLAVFPPVVQSDSLQKFFFRNKQKMYSCFT